MTHYDDSLTEVWSWKEKVHKEMENVPPSDYIAKLRKDSEAILKDVGIQLPEVSLTINDERIA